jgi:3',5'-cyclic AMP phosphodiesterase CpdA
MVNGRTGRKEAAAVKIVHLSDLHFSSGWFVSQWADAVAAHINHTRPDITVVTGDLTMEGRWDEYEQAFHFLKQLRTGSLLAVPGNHDVRNQGGILFEKMFGTRQPVHEDEALVVCGVDSSQPGSDEGLVGRSNLSRIANTVSVKGKTKVLALHHHLISVPGLGCGRQVPADSSDVLRLCAEAEIDLVLSGHKHLPLFRTLGNTHFITAGTATSRRLEGQSFPSFNVITIERGTVWMQLVDVTGGWGTQTIAKAKTRPGVATGTKLPRVTPPFAFEAEEFGSQIPDENWRRRLGVPQVLDFPPLRG